jgi:DNA-binding response OmpR family regulator
MAQKILVIEDYQSTVRFLTYTLEQEGFQTSVARNGIEGLRKAQEEKPDLIILDVMLPGLDGFEVCRRLRADAETAKLPILMLSAKAQEVDKTTGLKMGADMYMSKPAGPEKILAAVKSTLNKTTRAG